MALLVLTDLGAVDVAAEDGDAACMDLLTAVLMACLPHPDLTETDLRLLVDPMAASMGCLPALALRADKAPLPHLSVALPLVRALSEALLAHMDRLRLGARVLAKLLRALRESAPLLAPKVVRSLLSAAFLLSGVALIRPTLLLKARSEVLGGASAHVKLPHRPLPSLLQLMLL
jgi:hypothetical protein